MTDFLVIPQGKSWQSSEISFDRFCGKALNDAQAATSGQVLNVPITSKLFEVSVSVSVSVYRFWSKFWHKFNFSIF
jgi:hypothetical protein